MILPVICAGLPAAAYIARLTRGGMLEVIHSDFIRTARAKGLSERQVILKHALRGGMLPVVSYLGPGFSGLLVGSLVVEKIFNIPGMGRYFVEAAMNRDYNLVMGSCSSMALLMLFNSIVDVAYASRSPRGSLRHGQARAAGRIRARGAPTSGRRLARPGRTAPPWSPADPRRDDLAACSCPSSAVALRQPTQARRHPPSWRTGWAPTRRARSIGRLLRGISFAVASSPQWCSHRHQLGGVAAATDRRARCARRRALHLPLFSS
jgi:hypothetical protein